MISGTISTFAGFDPTNPQHLGWMKRKLARAQRYARRQSRRVLPDSASVSLPRHLQPRPPMTGIRAPLGRDEATMRWQRQLRASFAAFGRPMQHPQFERDAITGRIR